MRTNNEKSSLSNSGDLLHYMNHIQTRPQTPLTDLMYAFSPSHLNVKPLYTWFVMFIVRVYNRNLFARTSVKYGYWFNISKTALVFFPFDKAQLAAIAAIAIPVTLQTTLFASKGLTNILMIGQLSENDIHGQHIRSLGYDHEKEQRKKD